MTYWSVEHTHTGEDVSNEQKARIEELNSQVQAFYDQLRKKDEQIKTLEESLRKTPDPVKLAQLLTRPEELERHNSTLKEELEKASQIEEGLKAMHNNYCCRFKID